MTLEKDIYTYFENKKKIPEKQREAANLENKINALIDNIYRHRDFQRGESIQNLKNLRTKKKETEEDIAQMIKQQGEIEHTIVMELEEFNDIPLEFKVNGYGSVYVMVTVKDGKVEFGNLYSIG